VLTALVARFLFGERYRPRLFAALALIARGAAAPAALAMAAGVWIHVHERRTAAGGGSAGRESRQTVRASQSAAARGA